MGRQTGPPITPVDKAWMEKQHVFFVATAPLSPSHRINLSPKSAKEFRIVDDNTVCWLDYTGSGSETAAHVMENGRITIMFAALTGAPKILRLHGTARFILCHQVHEPRYEHITRLFEGELPGDAGYDVGFRCIFVMTVQRVSQSCGYSIPLFDYVKDRKTLQEVSAAKGVDGICAYRTLKNSFSIDGLPSITQMEKNSTPSKVYNKDGFLMSEYNANIFQRCKVYLWMLSRSYFIQRTARDMAMLAIGAFLVLLFQMSFPMISEITMIN